MCLGVFVSVFSGRTYCQFRLTAKTSETGTRQVQKKSKLQKKVKSKCLNNKKIAKQQT